jgi:hypothetical protein
VSVVKEIQKARKKPIEIEFIQFKDVESGEAIVEWAGNYNSVLDISDENKLNIIIMTLEGAMIADVYDYIIKGVNGEFYPCKPNIFEKTYEVL